MKSQLTHREEILTILDRSKIERRSIKYILQYGRKNGSDDDFFVVADFESDYQQIMCGRYDISVVNTHYANILLRNHDPFITEPIMTGECIFGHTSVIKVFVSKRKITDNDIKYLLNRAQELIYCANYWSSVGHYANALLSLIWANSYTCFAYAYFIDSGHVKLFKEIVNAPFASELAKLRRITKHELPRNKKLQVTLVIESKKMLLELLRVTSSLIFSSFNRI